MEAISSADVLEGEAFDALVATVDLVCVTDVPKDLIVRISVLSLSIILSVIRCHHSGIDVYQFLGSFEYCLCATWEEILLWGDVRHAWIYIL